MPQVKGYKAHATWGFPRGKIAKGESDAACAVREVLEETGLDISPHMKEDDFIELHLQEQRCKLFLIPGVSPAGARFAQEYMEAPSVMQVKPLHSPSAHALAGLRDVVTGNQPETQRAGGGDNCLCATLPQGDWRIWLAQHLRAAVKQGEWLQACPHHHPLLFQRASGAD